MSTWQDTWGAQTLGATLLGVFLWGGLGMSLTFKLVGWVTHIVLPNVDGLQLISLTRTKQWPLPHPPKKDIPPAWLPLNWHTGLFFSPSDSNRNVSYSVVSKLPTFKLKPHSQHLWVYSLPTADLGTYQPPQSHELIPYISLYMCKYIYTASWLCFSGEPWLIHPLFKMLCKTDLNILKLKLKLVLFKK